MNVIRHVTACVSKGIVTVQIECTSAEAARHVHRKIAAEQNAGRIVLEMDPPAPSAQRPMPPKPSLFNDETDAPAAPEAATIASVAMPEVA